MSLLVLPYLSTRDPGNVHNGWVDTPRHFGSGLSRPTIFVPEPSRPWRNVSRPRVRCTLTAEDLNTFLIGGPTSTGKRDGTVSLSFHSHRISSSLTLNLPNKD